MNYSKKIRSLYIVAYTMCMILTLIALCTGVIFIVSSNNDTMLEKEINNTPITTSMYYTTTMTSTNTTTNVVTTTITTITETTTTTESTTTATEEEYIEYYEEPEYTETVLEKDYIYTEIEEEIPDKNYTSDGTYYGTFEATYYEGGYGTYGAAGTDLISGYSIASNIFPLGSLIRIEGSGLDGIYRVDDRGGMADNVLDFYYQYGDTPSDFQFYGRMDVEVYLVS